MQHKYRVSSIFLGPGELSVHNGALLFTGKDGESVVVPVMQFSTVCLEPGTSVTHAAVALCSKSGCLLNWVGEKGVRLYSSGTFGASRSERLWCQAEQALNKNKRLSVARRMYSYRFSVPMLGSYNLEQLSGMEAGRVKATYKKLAERYGVAWTGRRFDAGGQDVSSRVNLCISTANSCLYGMAHTAILSAGYSPAMGFIHGKTALSFVYDVADLVKFQTVTRIAFEVAADRSLVEHAREVRIRCRDFFHKSSFLDSIIPVVDDILGFQEFEHERSAILQPFEFWDYAGDIGKQGASYL